MTYTYNLSGALIEETYPSGRVVKNTLDADGSLELVRSNKNSSDFLRTFASNFAYNAAGAVTAMKLGNGCWTGLDVACISRRFDAAVRRSKDDRSFSDVTTRMIEEYQK